MSARPEGFDDLLETMKTAAGALRAAGRRVHARRRARRLGARRADDRPRHRLPLRPGDARAAQDALAAAGFRPEAVPEEWLLKAWDGDVLVDLIFRPAGGPVGDAEFARADELEVMAVRMPVAVGRRRARDEAARASPSSTPTTRRRSRWRGRCGSRSTGTRVRAKTSESPFARAFFTLVEELGIADAAAGAAAAALVGAALG